MRIFNVNTLTAEVIRKIIKSKIVDINGNIYI